MMTFDFSPLYRSTIGFDRLASVLQTAMNTEVTSYPPYNIEALDESSYRITMAVAGFGENDITVIQEGQELIVKGQLQTNNEDRQYLYRGIAGRAFERRFQLAEHVKVGEAQLENGLLQISLSRQVPEALRPRKIAIGKGLQQRLTHQAA